MPFVHDAPTRADLQAQDFGCFAAGEFFKMAKDQDLAIQRMH
jgi:hypothetical protein